MKIHTLASLATLATVPLFALPAPYPLTENTFDNPDFVRRFVGTYGVDTAISPEMTREEADLFQTIAPLMERDPASAVAQIEAFKTTKANAGEDYSPVLDYTLGSLAL
ncbi:MAG: hypothetical protein ACOC3I_10030, partial [Verrucomicrobiota bacterium]